MKNDKLKKILVFAFYPLVLLRRKVAVSKQKRLAMKDPFSYIAMHYERYYKKKMNLENPTTLYEKIFWMEYYSDTSEWTRLTDKVAVRDYVKECGLENILNEVYAVYETVPEKNTLFKNLPNAFVLKTNNSGGGSAILVRDKNHCNKCRIIKNITKYFNDDYGARAAQPHYSSIEPKIVVEKLLINEQEPKKSLTDYKFFCFNGVPKCVNAIEDRNLKFHTANDQYFDMNWKRICLNDVDSEIPDIQQPSSFEEMIRIAKILSAPFPFVRVDLYEVDHQPIFGELTFTPGMDGFCLYEHNFLHYANLIDLSKVLRVKFHN